MAVKNAKSEDVTHSEFIPQTEPVYITEQVKSLTEKDLYSVIIQGILSRPLIRSQVSEVLSSVVVNTVDEKGNVVKDDEGKVCTHEEFKYPSDVIKAALTNAIVKSLVLEMNKKRTNSMLFTSLKGYICLCKSDTTEARVSGENFKECNNSEKPYIYADGIINGIKYTFVRFLLNNGVLDKDTVVSLKGIELANMVISSVGLIGFKNAIGSSNSNAGILTDKMKAFIREYVKSSNRSITRTIQALEADLKNKVEDRATDSEYLADIKEVARQLKDDMKAAKLIENTRSKSLIPNIEAELMVRFNRIVENPNKEENKTKEDN